MDQSKSIAVSMSDKLNNDMREKLSKEKVDFKVAAGWYLAAEKAMKRLTPALMGLTVDQFKDLYLKLNRESRLNCFDFAGLNNKIEELTADDLQMNMVDYFALQQAVESYAAKWSEQTNNLRQGVISNMMEAAKNIQPGQL